MKNGSDTDAEDDPFPDSAEYLRHLFFGKDDWVARSDTSSRFKTIPSWVMSVVVALALDLRLALNPGIFAPVLSRENQKEYFERLGCVQRGT